MPVICVRNSVIITQDINRIKILSNALLKINTYKMLLQTSSTCLSFFGTQFLYDPVVIKFTINMPDAQCVGDFKKISTDKSLQVSVKLKEKILSKKKFCSFELFSSPDNTDETYQQLFAEFEQCCPLFYSITWHHSVNVPPENHPSLKYFQKFSNIGLLHLVARGLNRQNVIHILNSALEIGKANIFVLQGDIEKPDKELHQIDFPYAVDLVKFIRAECGPRFSICVAGYPQMHPRSPSKEADLLYLKAKVDAGANFIITQIIFQSEVFIQFVEDCRRIGIHVPIIPGIYLSSNFNSLLKVSKKCNTEIPWRLLQDLELIKDDDEAVQEYVKKLMTRVVEEIFKSGASTGIHLFTLNRSKLALELCRRVGLCKTEEPLINIESLYA